MMAMAMTVLEDWKMTAERALTAMASIGLDMWANSARNGLYPRSGAMPSDMTPMDMKRSPSPNTLSPMCCRRTDRDRAETM